jgi:flavin reductase ActVB
MLDKEIFKRAMSCFPSGVTVITTTDGDGRDWGFTANAFSSLSLDPPLVLVCLSKKADCCSAFLSASKFGVNILRREHESLAKRFATKGKNKFAGGEFCKGRLGVPILPDAIATVECTMDTLVPGGDHTILIGAVEHVKVQDGCVAVYFKSTFHSLVQPRNVGSGTTAPVVSRTRGAVPASVMNIATYWLA